MDTVTITKLIRYKLAYKQEFEDLCMGVFKNLLLLSHGQASVERVFSVNKDVMVQMHSM